MQYVDSVPKAGTGGALFASHRVSDIQIALVSAAYPPDLDGIGDYTWWMAKTLAEHARVTSPVPVFTRTGVDHVAAEGVKVIPFFNQRRPHSFATLPGKLNEILGSSQPRFPNCLPWLVLEYNPFSFGRRGFCPSVPRTLARIRREKGVRVAIMFHELKVPRWPWKFALMHCWQEPIFRAVCRHAELAFVSAERWLLQVRHAAPNLPLHLLPVGSNIPLCTLSRDEARATIGIDGDALVLGVFGSAHLSRRFDWIAAAVEETKRRYPKCKIVLLYVGKNGRELQDFCSSPVFDGGVLAGVEVGIWLRAMDALMAPFSDGVSTRRGSVMAALQHGLPVATTSSPWIDRVWDSSPMTLLMSKAIDADAFAREVASWLEQIKPSPNGHAELSAFYARHFSWSQLAGHLVNVIDTLR